VKAELTRLRALPLLDEKMAQRIAEEVQIAFGAWTGYYADVKDLEREILRVATEAGKENEST